ncbi:hypothetical protein K2173_002610 [Erythroxylum novogranatense]|uniref:Zinc knuckle CX2CX4HX4C domain-containing protein n=1 Tax=Erythroxylum novogranatense TaxID=1862640 RepID=A0AAV8SWK3_9ROSI|nr:hypothetical protein K2173_002610 [Erythroxylum novogranatense]
MRIRVRLDVRVPLKRRKKITISPTCSFYARFQYEKLPLFCFLCGLLGHGESFCPERVCKPDIQAPFGWDNSLRAVTGRQRPPPSRWLCHDDGTPLPGSVLSVPERWGRDYDRALVLEKRRLKPRLENIRSINSNAYNTVQAELAQLLDLECLKWKQRAKEFWLAKGDTNSKFFHLSASTRKRHNTISELDDGSGILVRSKAGLQTIIRDYFEQLYTADKQSRANAERRGGSTEK